MTCEWLVLTLLTMVGVASADSLTDTRAQRRTPVVEAYERVRDSVVNISAMEIVTNERWGVTPYGELFMAPDRRNARSVGSGAVIHADGYIATNAHVVSSGAQLSVTFADGSEHEARVIGRDAPRDLAVVKIDPPHPLTPIALGTSDDLMIGETTIAVGNPVGLQNTVTTGIISALHRELRIGGRAVLQDVIQTDASINPGNSGGPLLNVLGELIGINTAIRADAQNIGFAIPVNQLRELLPEILDGEKLNKMQVGLKVSATEPVRVVEAREGGPAHAAGVRVGDVVKAVGDAAVERSVDFQVALLERRPGDLLALTIQRDGQPKRIQFELAPMPKPDGQKLAQQLLGVTLTNARQDVARRFLGQREGGVVVLRVDPDGPAGRRGVEPGDLLLSLGKYYARDLDQVGTLLEGARSGEPIDLTLRREFRGELYQYETRVHAR